MTTSGTTLLEAALAYAARGWPVFPCHTPTASGCSCRQDCGSCGKHPRTQHGLKDATRDERTIKRWWQMWPKANIGIATGAVSGLVVLDVDNYKGGDGSLRDLEQSYAPLPETMQQLTGGGGVQYFFAHPGVSVKNGVETLGVGLDIRGDGGYVIAPPSLHVSGTRYAWELAHEPDETPLAPMPDWLLARCQASAQREAPDAGAPIPKGQRNDTLFRLGCSLRAKGCTEAVLLAALQAMNATQCQPPLAEEEIATIAGSCAQYAPSTSREDVHQRRNGDAPDAAADDWRTGLLVTKAGDIKETFSNLVLVLQHAEPWASDAWYDVVRELPMVGTERLSDQIVSEAALALGAQARIAIRNLRLVHSALLYLCRQKPRDLLHEWLQTLPSWDGVERLTEWLSDHAGVMKTAYTMGVSRLLPVSMVARAVNPGCQCRSVVIFEGRENIGKSKLVELLASPDWYRDVSGSLEGKEAHMLLKGAWVVELSELSSMGKTQEARLKAFVTMANDEYVPKYANDPVKLARRTILVGTMNPEGDHASFSGQTGNTRFYPLVVNEIDLASVQAIREQLFAEALHYYQAHPLDWWQMSEDGECQARAERELRRQRGVYEDGLVNWLEKTGYTAVWWELLADEFLNLPKDRWSDRRCQMEVSKSLHGLGWTKQPQCRLKYQGVEIRVRPWMLSQP